MAMMTRTQEDAMKTAAGTLAEMGWTEDAIRNARATERGDDYLLSATGAAKDILLSSLLPVGATLRDTGFVGTMTRDAHGRLAILDAAGTAVWVARSVAEVCDLVRGACWTLQVEEV
jgi:hypothetical protein